MEYDAPFDPDEHGAEPIPEPGIGFLPFNDGDAELEPSFEPANDREGMSPKLIGALLCLLVLLSAAIVWWLLRGREGFVDGGGILAPAASAVSTPDAEEAGRGDALTEAEAVDLPPLSASDEFVRRSAVKLSEHPSLARWLANEDLVRRFVATVANIAAGESPRSHLDFMTPTQSHRARRVEGQLVTDPQSFDRYDLLVDVFTSLDLGTAVQLFHTMEPLFDQAYQEIGPPGVDFRQTLGVAIAKMLAVDVSDETPELEEAVLSYRYADPQLEALSPAEKHLLRLGPERAKRVQTKLQFLQAGLGLSSSAAESAQP